jgi:HAD superfamily hydrolase (TIGR01490 family)
MATEAGAATGGAPTPAGAAFFDLDKTLMQGSSAFQFVRAAYRNGLVSRRQLVHDGWRNLHYRLRGAGDDVSLALRDRIAADLEGTRVLDLERLAVDVLAGVLPRIYPQMLAIAHEHQDAGRRVYIVTAAAQELADLLARVMAFDGAIGSQMSEVVDGVFTGKPIGLFVYGEGKAQAIHELAQRERIDLTASYAYSDSESDLPMLRCVGHPVAVNPDRALLALARSEGWGVLFLDPLGRRLKLAGALSGAAAAGGITAAVVARRSRLTRQSTR